MNVVFEKDISVVKEHLDELQHVNNVTYLQWVQDVARAHWNALSNQEINDKYYWVVLKHTIEYKGQALLGDQILAKTFVSKNEGPKSTRHAEFYKEGKLLVKAETEWCLLDRKSHRPKRIPEEIATLFFK